MEVQFEDGQQDLSHEAPFADLMMLPDENSPAALMVPEETVRRLLRILFAKAAQIRQKDFYVLTQDEEDEIAPGLTLWINEHAQWKDVVVQIDQKGGISLFAFAWLWRIVRDLRERRQKEPKPEKRPEGTPQIGVFDPYGGGA